MLCKETIDIQCKSTCWNGVKTSGSATRTFNNSAFSWVNVYHCRSGWFTISYINNVKYQS